jgi:hypothetical protein
LTAACANFAVLTTFRVRSDHLLLHGRSLPVGGRLLLGAWLFWLLYSVVDVFSATNLSPHSQFYLIVLSGFFALAGFFRLLGTMCQSYDHAARLASVIITIMCARIGSVSFLERF